jgi:uncharacterized radical SAM protein YgiQ
MDRLYALPFTRRAHPSYDEPIPAAATLEGSLTSHRGCGGGCSFCSLAVHQGRLVQSRSEKSILGEITGLTETAAWKGTITDLGGPTSNMWGARCAGQPADCRRESCLYPKRCRNFHPGQKAQAELFAKAAALPGVRQIRAASGIRPDLALESRDYLEALVGNYVGGQLKIAPEHVSDKVLKLMRKPPARVFNEFIRVFERLSRAIGKEQYLVPYLMSAFPGCGEREMRELTDWLKRRGWRPRQVQCFLPTPGTLATAMFFSGKDADGRRLEVARSDAERLRLHRILMPLEDVRGGRDGQKANPRRHFKSRPVRSGSPARRRNDKN